MMFNLNEITSSSSSDFSPVPEGEYVLKFLSVELKETRSQTGKYLDFCFSIDQGQFANRRLWIKFNVINESSTAVNFALKNLKSLFQAAQIEISTFDLDDNGASLFRTIMGQDRYVNAKVTIQPENNGYKAKNDVEPYSWSPVGLVERFATPTPPWKQELRPKTPF